MPYTVIVIGLLANSGCLFVKLEIQLGDCLFKSLRRFPVKHEVSSIRVRAVVEFIYSACYDICSEITLKNSFLSSLTSRRSNNL